MSDTNMTVGKNSVVITNTAGLKPGSAIGYGAMSITVATYKGDVTVNELVELLESLKMDHYTDATGLNDCDFEWTAGIRKCSCGADEHNARIDAMVKRLKGERK